MRSSQSNTGLHPLPTTAQLPLYCIFCRRTSHRSIDCRTTSFYIHRKNRARSNGYCTKCIQPLIQSDAGHHLTCTEPKVSCAHCHEHSENQAKCGHNEVFCPLQFGKKPEKATGAGNNSNKRARTASPTAVKADAKPEDSEVETKRSKTQPLATVPAVQGTEITID
ncbi:Nanos-type domain-containing protein [Caenorhabditis elegans]|uniref:Nanos-type domain-containing protein n=1 Tax=Caenorhabditis elegans TaxID=6239 RepID=A0A8S4QBB1_CAEEL|nr:Nanos-type domain-containing protein [Caenorhabditis elegans]CAH2176197.1 Nanos-type domain-containing protein [Caenorhabditis elegans]